MKERLSLKRIKSSLASNKYKLEYHKEATYHLYAIYPAAYQSPTIHVLACPTNSQSDVKTRKCIRILRSNFSGAFDKHLTNYGMDDWSSNCVRPYQQIIANCWSHSFLTEISELKRMKPSLDSKKYTRSTTGKHPITVTVGNLHSTHTSHWLFIYCHDDYWRVSTESSRKTSTYYWQDTLIDWKIKLNDEI